MRKKKNSLPGGMPPTALFGCLGMFAAASVMVGGFIAGNLNIVFACGVAIFIFWCFTVSYNEDQNEKEMEKSARKYYEELDKDVDEELDEEERNRNHE